MERFAADAVVIGAGAVGLAVARALGRQGRDVLVLEKEPRIGEHQSSRNSEVIHAGIYYKPKSNKSKYCILGKDLLYRYCEQRGIKHKIVGKLVVATAEEQLAQIEAININAHSCGMTAIEILQAREAIRMESSLHCVAALWSPTSGIFDSHGYMLALMAEIEDAGGVVALNSPVERICVLHQGFEILIGGAASCVLTARTIVNCGGIFAPAIARSIDAYPVQRIPDEGFARGNYFSLRGNNPFSRLIYPVPEPGGLGVHLTIDLSGQARFGPDVEWIDSVDYRVNGARLDHMYKEIRKYWRGLPDDALSPSYAGIRAKIGPRLSTQDFVIDKPADHGIPGLVQMFGIESPGLTSSLALADSVVEDL